MEEKVQIEILVLLMNERFHLDQYHDQLLEEDVQTNHLIEYFKV